MIKYLFPLIVPIPLLQLVL